MNWIRSVTRFAWRTDIGKAPATRAPSILAWKHAMTTVLANHAGPATQEWRRSLSFPEKRRTIPPTRWSMASAIRSSQSVSLHPASVPRTMLASFHFSSLPTSSRSHRCGNSQPWPAPFFTTPKWRTMRLLWPARSNRRFASTRSSLPLLERFGLMKSTVMAATY